MQDALERREASQRSRDRAWPAPPIVRYNVNMTFTWSSPKSASGTRWAYEIATTNARTEVTRVLYPIVNRVSTASEAAWAYQVHRAGTSHQNEYAYCSDWIARTSDLLNHGSAPKKSSRARPQTACV